MERKKINKITLSIALVFVLAWIFIPTDKDEVKEKAKQEKKMADKQAENHAMLMSYGYAVEAVKARLKNPKAAEFPGAMEKIKHIRYLGDKNYEINSWVESTNSFGAVLRTPWKAKVFYDIEGNTVQVMSVEI
jgi:hypothetical protein